MKKKKLKSISYLKRKADKLFSVFIRVRDCNCFTCGRWLDFNSRQNGHYISRNHLNTRYDEQNCNTQCVSCNVFKKGNMAMYALNLTDKYGAEILRDLDVRKRLSVANTREFLNDIIRRYEQPHS
jgi:hypothetical protein